MALESGVEDDDEGREVSRDERFFRSKGVFMQQLCQKFWHQIFFLKVLAF